MKKTTRTLLILLLCTGFNQLQAQQLSIKDFVLFGKEKVQLSSSSTIIDGGKVGSNSLIKSTGTSNISSSLHSGEKIELANSNTVSGNITAANAGNHTATSVLIGSNAVISGSLNANGNIIINSGTVNGPIVSSGSYSGPQPTSGSVIQNGNPVIPVLPELPELLVPANYSTTNPAVTNTATISPGAYRNMALNGNKTITFNGGGDYVFESILNSGNFNKFIFDFNGNANAAFRIFVTGNVDLNKILIEQKNLPLANPTSSDIAARVLMQVNGTGGSNGYAWSITNGASGNNQSNWFGTVVAPNGSINVGSGSSLSKIIGGLWSGKIINVQSGVSITFVPLICSTTIADAGDDKTITCPGSQTIGTLNSVGVSFKWTINIDGTETIAGSEKTLTVSKPGLYTLSASNNCGIVSTDEVVVSYNSCIDPINETNNGKVDNIIGHELTYLTTKLEESIKHIMLVGAGNDSVLIEAVAYVGKENQARDTLWKYGMRSFIPNGINPLLITGSFPIANLMLLTQPGPAVVINHIKPVFIPIGNSGIVTSAGDVSVGANLVRSGFDVKGEGVKIGVISDSYNTLNTAGIDVANGDIPGAGNPDGNTTPVQVIQEFPWGVRSDEGRAMMQIIHDLAPKANFAFRTGFISAGDFAYGILQLKDAGCRIIVDDVTYITEPFYKDGIVSKAVDMVTAEGVSYFTSAGNFGSKSYSNVFNPVTLPGISGSAHNFGGGDVYQRLRLKPGTYTIVLQWQDDVYSLGNSTLGTLNDLDIYLVDPGGRIGFNRNNLGGDPLEVLSFSINLPDPNQTVDADLLIVKAGTSSGAVNPHFKYVIFRGDAVIDEYHSSLPLQNKSTIVGHANSENAVSVGAVLWSNTPAFGVTAPTVASFSSTGGTPVYTSSGTVVRAKPELTGPNGVNTSSTVPMGPDNDGTGTSDGFPNFYGTSAAAPHAAAVAALVLDARKKYYDQTLNPAALKSTLFNTAIPMQPDGVIGGVNYKAGYGLVHADLAIRSFANPTPVINSLDYNDDIIPGETNFTVTVTGEHLTANSVIYFNGLPIVTQVNTSLDTLTGEILPFTGNPPLTVFNPSFEGATNDGGFSNTLYFFDAEKLSVTIVADNKTKMYGEDLPAFTATILVNGDSLHNYNHNNGTTLTLADLGVDNLSFRYSDPSLNSLTSTGNYQIRVTRTFDPNNPADQELLAKYDYDSTFGNLQITPLHITVAPRDTTIMYGSAIKNIQFNYTIPTNANISNTAALLNNIKIQHQQQLANDVIAFANGVPVAIVNGVPVPVVNIMINGVPVAVVNGVPVSLVNGVPVSVVNGGTVVYVNNEALPVVNGQSIKIVNGNPLVLANVLANGVPVAIVNGVPLAFLNAVPVSYVNGVPVSYVNGVPVSYVNSISNGAPVAIINGVPVSYVNTLDNNALANKGFMATSNAIENARTISNTVIVNGTSTTQTTKIVDLTQQSILSFTTDPDAAGTSIVSNKGILNLAQLINGVPVAYVNGVPVPVVNTVPVSIVNGVPVAVINGVPVPIVNSDTKIPVIIDIDDLSENIQSLKSVNVITGINAGVQTLIPGALLSSNYQVQYLTGTVNILPASLSIKARDTSKVFGDEITLDTTKYIITSGSLLNGDEIKHTSLNSSGTSASAFPGNYAIIPNNAVGKEGTDINNYIITYINGNLTVRDNENCLITHSKFSSFGSTTKSPTSLWLNIEIKMSGQLTEKGDYIMYSGGSVTFTNITSEQAVTDAVVKRGIIIADNVQEPTTYFDVQQDMFITKVPLGFSSTSDIFISGSIINSSNGFTKKNNPSSTLKGIFYSNKNYSEQWNYAMAAYQKPGGYVAYSDLSATGSIVAHNGTYKAGTPLPWITYVVSGGSGNGGNNYTGSSSSNDNFSACPIISEIITSRPANTLQNEIAKATGFEIYPNPASSFVTISFVPLKTGRTTITIMSIDGRKIMETFNGVTEAGINHNKQMFINDLPPGLYIIQLRINNSISVKKLLITSK